MNINFPPAVNVAFKAFSNNTSDPYKGKSNEIRVCGGAVRDILLGKTPKDWDMCTPMHPKEVYDTLDFHGLNPYDLSNGHGTVSFAYQGDVVEITTLRIDAATDGRHAQVVFVSDFQLDAARRDFTINAMSVGADSEIFDYFRGRDDLANRIIRFCGADPASRIKEDYLRILRYFRFLGRFSEDGDRFDNSYDKRFPFLTLYDIHQNVAGLKQISGERIWMEMQQIFAGNNAAKVLTMMEDLGVLDAIGIKLKE